jgi:hypothetical protein
MSLNDRNLPEADRRAAMQQRNAARRPMNPGQIRQPRLVLQIGPSAPFPASKQTRNGRRRQYTDGIPSIQRIASKFPESTFPKDNPERQMHRAEMAVDSSTAVRQAKQRDWKSLPGGRRQSRNAKQLPESLLSLARSKTDYRPLHALCQRLAFAIAAATQLLSIACSDGLGIVHRQRKRFSHPIAVFRRCNSTSTRIQSRADRQ